MRILLVEDSPSDAAILRWTLAHVPHAEVTTHVERLGDAILALAQPAYDVVLLDLGLPDSSGLATLKAVDAVTETPIIVLTGIDDQELALESIQAGSQDYLTKGQVDGPLLGRALKYAVERSRILAALRASEQRYALAMAGARDGLWDWELQSDRLTLSVRWKEMLGYRDDELASTVDTWFANVHANDLDGLRAAIKRHLDGLAPHFECEYRMRHKDGSHRWLLTRGLAVRDCNGKAERLAGSQTDITERHTMEDRLEHDALHDPLTGSPNRSCALRVLERQLDLVRRDPGAQFSVLFLDLDRFKQFNDRYGHILGDQLLIEFAQRLRGCVRPTDTVARLSGDEFLVILGSAAERATEVAQRILDEMRRPFLADTHALMVSTSIGVVVAGATYHDTAAILRDADAAMYRAKATGRQTYEVFASMPTTTVVASVTQEDELRAAIDAGQIETYFQPIVALADGRLMGLEAFSRWRRGGALLPCADFIATAQQAGLVHRLTEQALRDACSRLSDWTHRGIVDLALQVCINVTERQLLEVGFLARLEQILGESGTSAKRIRIDVTQRRTSPGPTQTEDVVSALRERGLCVDIDDFDGSSSMGVLRDTSVDAVKIDHSVVLDGQLNDSSVAFVDGLIRLAHLLGKKVIAERVETDLEARTLKELTCDFAQGHFFSRPLSAVRTEQFLTGL